MDKIIEKIKAERQRQDKKWGGPAHDDQHHIDDWCEYILERCDRLGSMHSNSKTNRRALIQIAALAIAALESQDRIDPIEHQESLTIHKD